MKTDPDGLLVLLVSSPEGDSWAVMCRSCAHSSDCFTPTRHLSLLLVFPFCEYAIGEVLARRGIVGKLVKCKKNKKKTNCYRQLIFINLIEGEC